MSLTNLIVEQVLNGIITGSTYALMAVGLSLVWGILDLFNFSHGVLYMLGAYCVYYLTQSLGLNLIAATFLSIAILFALGYFLEILIIKPLKPLQTKDNWAWETGTIVVTLGFAILGEAFALLAFGPNYKTLPPIFEGVVDFKIIRVSEQMLLSLFLSIFLITVLCIFLKYSKVGRGMRAISQQPSAALLMGINTDVIFPLTFGVSAALAGAAGALMAPIYNIYPSIGWIPFGVAFNVVVIGGLGSIYGSIIAALLLGIIGSVSTIWVTTGWVPVISFSLMILVLIIRPAGLFGIAKDR